MSKTIDKLYCVRQKTEAQQQNRPAAHFGAQRPRVPGHSMGLGRERALPPGPNLACSVASRSQPILVVGYDQTALRDPRGIKTRRSAAPP